MQEKIAIIGADARQFYLAQNFLQDGFPVLCCGVENMPDTPVETALQDAAVLALPIPAWSKSSGILPENYWNLLSKDCKIFGGAISPVQNFETFDYLQDEALVTENAVATAEGAIRIVMQNLPTMLTNSKILVIGYGRIGKLLCDRLHALHAEVTVSARSEKDFALIRAAGLQSERTGVYLKGLTQYDAIINTVPANVLMPYHLNSVSPFCLIVDLASGKGGLQTAPSPNLHYIHALALPGIDAPKSIAVQMHRMIMKEVFK